MALATSKMPLAVILTWLLASGSVHAAPTLVAPSSEAVTQTDTGPAAFRTQYPPGGAENRVLEEPQGIYPTALEREGHPSVQPFPPQPTTQKQQFLNLNGLLDSLTGSVGGSSDSVLDLLLPHNQGQSNGPETSAPASTESTEPAPSTQAPAIVDNGPLSDVSTSTPTPTQLSTPASTVPASTIASVVQGDPTMLQQDVFVPLPTGPVPSSVTSRNDHPVPREGITNSTGPVETNKFYAGFFLGSQSNVTFTHPYSMAWSKGGGMTKSWGLAISHIESNLLAMGPADSRLPGNPASYYINPIGIQSLVLSAAELDTSTVLTTDNPMAFSAHISLQPQAGSSQKITFPLVQGMAFVTGIYTNLTPVIESGVGFLKLVTAGSPRSGIFKYQATLEDGTSWLIYVTPSIGGADPNLNLTSNSAIRGPAGFTGTVQVAKNPAGTLGEKFYDNSSGVYPVEGSVAGSVSATTGTYALTWKKAGKNVDSTPLLMYALPHHVESFDNSTSGRVVNMHLRTSTKGNATAVVGESWVMTEADLPMDMGFAPWTPAKGSVRVLSSTAQQAVLAAAPTELQQDVIAQSDLDSMYFSGKVLSKFATLVYTVSQLGQDPTSAATALANLKTSFARFINNQQKFPLVYDAVWHGVVSSASYGGDSGADFGNTYYNDHHFHYGYFIHAAAIIGALDPSWLTANKDWVNMLVRDAGNAAADDPYFPFSRSFDWFHGHSWAKGLFESSDGKDQESTSEDVMFAYALKMWGKTIGDASMEARGNLMLGVLRRSLRNYFLLESTNENQPGGFVGNKVTGILFENKVDHTTYFGNNLEYVQGIHMLPLLPSSAYVRRTSFVAEEWNAIFAANASDPAANVVGGWKGVIYANLALIDPVSSYNFFAQSNFDYSWIDGGASRTWYLAYAAGLGGA